MDESSRLLSIAAFLLSIVLPCTVSWCLLIVFWVSYCLLLFIECLLLFIECLLLIVCLFCCLLSFCLLLILLLDVADCLENSFVTSKYPVILSIENHCCNEQQLTMVKDFVEILGGTTLINYLFFFFFFENF
jgi:hypothetical protein